MLIFGGICFVFLFKVLLPFSFLSDSLSIYLVRDPVRVNPLQFSLLFRFIFLTFYYLGFYRNSFINIGLGVCSLDSVILGFNITIVFLFYFLVSQWFSFYFNVYFVITSAYCCIWIAVYSSLFSADIFKKCFSVYGPPLSPLHSPLSYQPLPPP